MLTQGTEERCYWLRTGMFSSKQLREAEQGEVRAQGLSVRVQVRNNQKLTQNLY